MLRLLPPEQHTVPPLQSVLPIRFEAVNPPLEPPVAIRQHDYAGDHRVVVHVRLDEGAAAVVPARSVRRALLLPLLLRETCGATHTMYSNSGKKRERLTRSLTGPYTCRGNKGFKREG